MSGLLSMLSGSTELTEVEITPTPQQDDNGDVSLEDMIKVATKLQSMLRGIRARRDLPPGFGSWGVESSPHSQARSENNPFYRGKRTPVKDDQVLWSVTWEEYAPAEFNAQVVLDNARGQDPPSMGWADPPDPKLSFSPDLERRLTFENGGMLVFDSKGYPLNPRGRTGLCGRGLLGAWGPNHAADPIVTRREPLTGTIQVLAIKRNDTGEWALPGGMVKPGDSVSATVKKSINEVGNFKDPAKQEEFDALVKVLFAQGVDVHAGYVDDPRNTDNAWMESKVMHFHCSPELGEMLPLNIKKTKDKKKEKGGQVGWIDCSKSAEPRYANMYGSHMDWVEGIKKAMTQDGDDSAVAHIQMEGMDEHESAFATHKGPIDVELAQKYSMARRCVAIRKDGEKDAINSKGEAIKVDTYNFRTGKIKDLDTYHCGLAVQLYMYFHIDAFILFFALFLVSIYAWAENHSRNSLRNKCRDFVKTWVHGEDTETAGMTLKQWIMQEDEFDECGYSALGYAPGLSMDPVSSLMMPGSGTCDEMTSSVDSADGLSMAPGLPSGQNVSIYKYVGANSELCSGVFFPEAKLVSYWLEFVTVLILIAFFIDQFNKTRSRTKHYDEENLTTSDFSVMLTGLDREVDVDDGDDGTPGLESKLLGDLERMGYKREDIYKVEVARFCKEPIQAMAKLAQLRTQRQELQASRAQSTTRDSNRGQVVAASSPAPAPAEQPSDLKGSQRASSSKMIAVSDAPVSRVVGLVKRDSDLMMGALSTGKEAMEAAIADGLEKLQEQAEASLQEQLHDTENQLSALVKAKDQSTGHAFITFNHEAKRNDFMKRLRVPSLVQRIVFNIVLRLSSLRRDKMYALGARVSHPDHGEGVIDGVTRDGKKNVLFDSGSVHAYAIDSLDKLTPLTKSDSDVHEARLGFTKVALSAREFVYSSRLRRKLVFHSAAGGKLQNLKVQVAPDPSDIYWENLEMSRGMRLFWKISGDVVLAFLVILSAMLLITTTFYSSTRKMEISDKLEQLRASSSSTSSEINAMKLEGLLYGLANAAVVLVTNEVLTIVVLKLSKKAGPTSQTGYQRSIFSMLSFLYLINTSITPFVVATLESFRTGHATFGGMSFLGPSKDGDNRLIYQLWYNTGSIVNQMVINLAVTGVSFCFTQMVSGPALLKRYVLARGANSQNKLNQLWMPPPLKVGQNQAKLYKAMALVLIYAPMYPPMYLFAAAYLVPSFFATRFGIAHLFAQPSRMDQTVTESMRGWLAGTIGISLVIKRLMTAENIYSRDAANIPLYLSVAAWAVYMVMYEGFAKTLSNEEDLNSVEGDGKAFKDLDEDEYVCPKLHRGGASSGRDKRSSKEQV